MVKNLFKRIYIFIILGEGSKWSHTALKKKYREMGIDPKTLFDNIADVILKTCISAEPFMLDINAKGFK